ncbi:unnamed protein product, partial [marine sediment metagenome]
MDFITEIVELNEENVLELLKKRLQDNDDPLNVMDDVKKSMKIIGDKFSKKEYFLPELIMSGEILRQIFEELGPRLKEAQSSEKKKGKV